MNDLNKALITCDFEGKIKTFDNNATLLFDYASIDVINIKRIYNLIHPEYVLIFINKLNLFINNKKIILQDETVFSTSNNQYFNATVILKKNTSNLINIEIKKISDIKTIKTNLLNFDKINMILRSKFVVGSLIPFFFSIIWVFYKFNSINIKLISLIFISVCLLHACANTFNDYFDWVSGRDKANLDYVLFSTGGSRVIDLKFISERTLLLISIFLLLIVILIGVYFIYIGGWIIFTIGAFSIFSVYFYSAPPIHLASRYGLGELMHIICLGPLILAGSTLLLSGDLSFIDFFIGLPFGLLITGCLLMNEYPDSKFDKFSGKINLAVLLGEKYIPYMYILFQILSFLSVLLYIYSFNLTSAFYLILLIIPYAVNTTKTIFKISVSRKFISDACIKSFNLYIYFSFILTSSLILHILYNKVYP